MKQTHKIVSAVLACTMSLLLFTACGGITQAQLEAYIKEKGYITREEAQALAGGDTTIIQQTVEAQDLVTATNAVLKEKNSDVTIKESEELKNDAQKIVDAYVQQDYTTINALKSEIQSKNKIIILSSSETTAVSADELATVILKYKENGKAITAIGCSTTVGSYRADYTSTYMEIDGSLFCIVASYETVA